MSTENLKLQADANLFKLGENPYPGRGVVVGLDKTGEHLIQVYWIMGRSENSRNRVFGHDGKGRLFTEAADPSKVKDPSLIIYNAMRESHAFAIVSNGHQTDSVAERRSISRDFHDVMRGFQYEPDAPNFTSRITARSWWDDVNPAAEMSVLRKSPWSDACDRHLYEINDFGKEFGYCITTYRGDGDPLPTFQGEPYLLPLVGDASQVAKTYWEVLNAYNRVSLAVKFVPMDGPSNIVIINKYSKIG